MREAQSPTTDYFEMADSHDGSETLNGQTYFSDFNARDSDGS